MEKRSFLIITIVDLELTEKPSSTQAVVDPKENGLAAQRKDSPPKIAPKKSRKHKLFKSKEVTVDVN